MKIPTSPGAMQKHCRGIGFRRKQKAATPEEAKRQAAQKKLEAIGFASVAARILSYLFRAMAKYDTQAQRDAKLKLFSDIANER